ncbi:MAG: hypothetical protein JRN35_04675 [Nitrososphaerota archaeon]|nr:hypothetical protein [Nitrososphaerota archaeon]
MSATVAALVVMTLALTPFHLSSPEMWRADSDFSVTFHLDCRNVLLSSAMVNVTFFNNTTVQSVSNFTVVNNTSYDYQNDLGGNLGDVQEVIAVAEPPAACASGSSSVYTTGLNSTSSVTLYLNFTGDSSPAFNFSSPNATGGIGHSTSLFSDFVIAAGIGLFVLITGPLLLTGFRKILLPPEGR